MPPFFYIGHNYSMKDYSNHIGIIGAGISGLALGSILKTNNIPCVIFEKSKNISEYGAGISLSTNGMRVLESLGISENLKATSGRPSQATFYSDNFEITKIPVDVITTSRKNLYKVLLDKYLSLNGELHFDYELSNLSEPDQLPLNAANAMVENVIGKIEIPLGVATNFRVNLKDYLIPMAIEEPSVVAAASNMAKVIRSSGGFTASSHEPIMRAQIQILNVAESTKAKLSLKKFETQIIKLANSKDKTLVKF